MANLVLLLNKPDINDISLKEIIRFSELYRSNFYIGYPIDIDYNIYMREQLKKIERGRAINFSDNNFRDAVKYCLFHCDEQYQEKIRPIILSQINDYHFVSLIFDKRQYWILSNKDDGKIEKYLENGIEYYHSAGKIYQYHNDKWFPEQYQNLNISFGKCLHPHFNDNFPHYRTAFIQLETQFCFAIADRLPLDLDIITLIKSIIYKL